MKKFLILISVLFAIAYARFMPAYLVDKDFGLSRLLTVFDARFTNYHRLFLAIEPGMTRAEVEQVLELHYPEGGERKMPKRIEDTEQRLSLFMDPEHLREPNCEGIWIRFEGGVVTGKDYSMD